MADHNNLGIVAGRFLLEGKLGRGNFGQTYLAFDQNMQNRVVLKQLLDKWLKKEGVRERFINEAIAMRKASNEHIVTVYDLLTPESNPGVTGLWIVMEYMDGGSLDHLMEQGLKWEDAVRICIAVCRGLDPVHLQKIVHRDIKPANILLSADLQKVKVSDFGVAHLPDRHLTVLSGGHPGTLVYMAPELFGNVSAQDIDGRVDEYAMGVMLYQILTGREYLDYDDYQNQAEREVRVQRHVPPNAGLTYDLQKDVDDLAQKYWVNAVRNDAPSDPRKHNPQIPEDLARITLRTLAKSPDQRYATMGELADELSRVRLGEAGKTTTSWQANMIVERVEEALKNQQYTAALELAQQAVSLDPDSVRAHTALGNVQMRRSNFSEAITAWEQVMSLEPGNPEACIKLGECLNRTGRCDKAIEIQREALRNPANRTGVARHKLYTGLAMSFYMANRLDEALWALDQALSTPADDNDKLKLLRNQWEARQTSL
jgi:serine/threonine protein kinase